MTWPVWFLAGALATALLWALTDKDTVVRNVIRKIKVKGPGSSLDLDLDMDNLPPGVKKRHVRKLERLKRKLKK